MKSPTFVKQCLLGLFWREESNNKAFSAKLRWHCKLCMSLEHLISENLMGMPHSEYHPILMAMVYIHTKWLMPHLLFSKWRKISCSVISNLVQAHLQCILADESSPVETSITFSFVLCKCSNNSLTLYHFLVSNTVANGGWYHLQLIQYIINNQEGTTEYQYFKYQYWYWWYQ